MIPTSIQGIPAHPLFVHIPVVLIPLIGLSAIAMVFWKPLRAKLGWVTVGLSFVAVVVVQLALETGESLERRLPHSELIEKHSELADAMRPLAIAMFLLLLAFVLLELRKQSNAATGKASTGAWYMNRFVGIALSALLLVSVVGANYRIYEVGHSGAKAVWHDTPAERFDKHSDTPKD